MACDSLDERIDRSMNVYKRILPLILVLVMLCSSSALAGSKKDNTPVARQITTDIVRDIPETIQQVLDLAYEQLIETDAAELKKKNKYTEWRNQYEYGWCGGFITWCMLQLEVPQEVKNKIKKGEVEGLFHVKEAGVGKMYTGYENMNRITRVPQKGFIAVYGTSKAVKGSGVTPYYHVGLVYDVEKLSDDVYRITTIEGNVNYPGDETHKKATHTIRMYTRDYHLNAEKKKDNLTLVPEEERDREESAVFSYDYTYANKYLYITIFLMPWIPEEETAV